MDRWVGKVAVVTGASSGIGASIVVDLVKAGLTVVGLARRKDRVEALREKVPSELKDNLLSFECDVSNDESITDAFKWISDKLGVVHVLVNNAGIVKLIAITDEGNEDSLKATLNTNLWGLVLVTKKSVEIMKREKVIGAHIININSVVGHKIPYSSQKPTMNLYPSTKYGVTALTEVLRQEFNHDNFQFKVTSVSPGMVRTEIMDDNVYNYVKHLQPEDVSQSVLYALSTPPHVNVSEIIVRPVGELF